MVKAWSLLPNAHHIDWVLASLKETPELWDAAKDAAWDAVWDTAWSAAMFAVWDTDRDVAMFAAWSEARYAARDATRDAARSVISALFAYDDCDQLLSMSYERLKVWAVLSEDHRAVLLLPMVYVKEKLANLNLQPA